MKRSRVQRESSSEEEEFQETELDVKKREQEERRRKRRNAADDRDFHSWEEPYGKDSNLATMKGHRYLDLGADEDNTLDAMHVDVQSELEELDPFFDVEKHALDDDNLMHSEGNDSKQALQAQQPLNSDVESKLETKNENKAVHVPGHHCISCALIGRAVDTQQKLRKTTQRLESTQTPVLNDYALAPVPRRRSTPCKSSQ